MSLIEKALAKTRSAARGPSTPALRGELAPSGGVEAAASGATARVRAEPARRIQVDMLRLREQGIIAPPESQYRHAAEVRGVKRRLLKAVSGGARKSRRVIMLSSSLPSEGKTFTSVNLALSIALEKDYHVLLIDGDVAKPNVSRLFGLDSAKGLLDATQDPALDVESLVVGTDLPRFDLLPAGSRSIDATESLSSARMRGIIDDLAAVPGRIVLIDSPPLLLTTEAIALAQHADHVVLVVRANSTPERAVQDSIALLGEREGISLLLNDIAPTKLDNLYYGYVQGYGDYGVPSSTDSKADQSVPDA